MVWHLDRSTEEVALLGLSILYQTCERIPQDNLFALECNVEVNGTLTIQEQKIT